MKISDMRRYDSKKMYEAYDRWPEIAQENYFSQDLEKIQFKNIEHIVLAGSFKSKLNLILEIQTV